ncbi:hypothetical protein V8C86DRAFT_3023801 [Haematococcus lacustris]
MPSFNIMCRLMNALLDAPPSMACNSEPYAMGMLNVIHATAHWQIPASSNPQFQELAHGSNLERQLRHWTVGTVGKDGRNTFYKYDTEDHRWTSRRPASLRIVDPHAQASFIADVSHFRLLGMQRGMKSTVPALLLLALLCLSQASMHLLALTMDAAL